MKTKRSQVQGKNKTRQKTPTYQEQGNKPLLFFRSRKMMAYSY